MSQRKERKMILEDVIVLISSVGVTVKRGLQHILPWSKMAMIQGLYLLTGEQYIEAKMYSCIVAKWLLTCWSLLMHICVSKLTTIGSHNGLSPGRCHAIIWTNPGILLIGHIGTHFSEILIKIYTFSFRKMHLKISSEIFCFDLSVLNVRSHSAVLLVSCGIRHPQT